MRPVKHRCSGESRSPGARRVQKVGRKKKASAPDMRNVGANLRNAGKGKALMPNATSHGGEADDSKRIDPLRFGINKMQTYYVYLKEKRYINAEARFKVESFKDDLQDIYDQFQIRDWDPFTIPLDPYFQQLVRESYSSYKARKDILKHKG
ncbi:hypothetical protein HAX54_040516 [Datura stramonium]|uniref:Uncharacterized protein n=1 Tax=Datura stramonium TaxID=4076 RepID=A0ABS8VQY4_DATST|nr:hypothetical protein [Datura stramonium]